mgnify:CR=1 FL=1
MLAAGNGQRDAAELLIRKGADAYAKDEVRLPPPPPPPLPLQISRRALIPCRFPRRRTAPALHASCRVI